MPSFGVSLQSFIFFWVVFYISHQRQFLVRCGLAVLYGAWLAFGRHAIEGAGLLMGVNLITFLPFIFCSTYLGANIDSFGSKILLSGTVNAIGLFLLIWVYCYTSEHEEEEKTIISALLAAVGSSNTSDSSADPVVPDVTSEAEF
jgi:hypothetical protein